MCAARPHYGGALRIETTDAGAMAHVNALAYEPLLTVDSAGGLRGLLATSWDAEASGRRWVFHVRSGVTLHDGSILEPSQVAMSLTVAHPDWQVHAEAGGLAIDVGHEAADLPWRLADQSNAIAIRSSAGALIGSGPFRIERVDAGLITLRAHEDYWDGRPFADVVEVRTARSAADRIADVESGRADMVSIEPTDIRRVEQRQLRVEASRPLALYALAFEAPLATSANDSLRRALATAIDRGALSRVVLQARAEPADALLPKWVSGYPPFVLERSVEPLSRAAIAALPAGRRTLALRVSASDPTAQAIAQRIAVNAHDAGFTVNVQAPIGLGPRFDLRLLRVSFRAAAPADALLDIMNGLGTRTLNLAARVVAPDPEGASLEDVLRTERALLERDVMIPIVHVPELYALGARFQSWNGPAVSPSGGWTLANGWLSPP